MNMESVLHKIRSKVFMQDESELDELLKTHITLGIDHCIWECIDSSLLTEIDSALGSFERELNE